MPFSSITPNFQRAAASNDFHYIKMKTRVPQFTGTLAVL
jgi:hypothetical protein